MGDGQLGLACGVSGRLPMGGRVGTSREGPNAVGLVSASSAACPSPTRRANSCLSDFSHAIPPTWRALPLLSPHQLPLARTSVLSPPITICSLTVAAALHNRPPSVCPHLSAKAVDCRPSRTSASLAASRPSGLRCRGSGWIHRGRKGPEWGLPRTRGG